MFLMLIDSWMMFLGMVSLVLWMDVCVMLGGYLMSDLILLSDLVSWNSDVFFVKDCVVFVLVVSLSESILLKLFICFVVMLCLVWEVSFG